MTGAQLIYHRFFHLSTTQNGHKLPFVAMFHDERCLLQQTFTICGKFIFFSIRITGTHPNLSRCHVGSPGTVIAHNCISQTFFITVYLSACVIWLCNILQAVNFWFNYHDRNCYTTTVSGCQAMDYFCSERSFLHCLF